MAELRANKNIGPARISLGLNEGETVIAKGSLRSRWKPTTIRGRTTLAAAVVVSAGMALGGAYMVSTLHDRLVVVQRGAAELRARDVGTLAASGRLPQSLSIPGEEKGLIQVIDLAGTVVSRSENVAGEAPILSAAIRTLPSWKGFRTQLPIGEGERFAVISMQIKTPSGRMTVITAESLEAADDAAAALRRLLLFGIPPLILLVVLVARKAVSQALEPVNAMTKDLMEITSKHLNRRVTQPVADDEIAGLARTMNALLERLERSSDRQRRFVADASHELRSPLTSIRTALEVAQAHPSRIDPHVAIRDALQDHDRIDLLVADLLTLARLDESALVGQPIEVDLATLAARDIAARGLSPNIQLITALQPALVVGSENQLQRLIRNLVDNAVRHAAASVTVTTEVAGNQVILRVGNDGAKIGRSDVDRIFERFTRLDDSRTADDGGTGLGLAIVQQTVLAHGGTIRVVDDSSHGALFEVSIPSRKGVSQPEPPTFWSRAHLHRVPKCNSQRVVSVRIENASQ